MTQIGTTDAALASARPAPAQEQGEETRQALIQAIDRLRRQFRDEGRSEWLAGAIADWIMGPGRALLARKPPEAKGESGEAAELRDALELMVDAAMGSGDATQALGIARALLEDGRKLAKESYEA